MLLRSTRAWNWLIREWHWPAACLFAAALLLAAAPAWYAAAGLPLLLVYLQLPAYLVHQWEEHTGDRFRQYINRTIGGGREALTPAATFWINALGVWGVDLAALGLALAVHPALGLVAVYLPLVNSLGHIGPALARREYNPGLWTAATLFLPLGGLAWYVLVRAGAPWQAHALGLGVAVAVHVAIVAQVARRLAKLRLQFAASAGRG